MDYLKIIKNDTIRIATTSTKCEELDTNGYMAKLKVSNGTLYLLCNNKKEKYPLEVGEHLDFIGKIRFFGTAEVHYILFDRV